MAYPFAMYGNTVPSALSMRLCPDSAPKPWRLYTFGPVSYVVGVGGVAVAFAGM
jgi:hypothetical protein